MRIVLDLFFVFPCFHCSNKRERISFILCSDCQTCFFENCIRNEIESTLWGKSIQAFQHQGPMICLYQELLHSKNNRLLLALASIVVFQYHFLDPVSILITGKSSLEDQWTKALAKVWTIPFCAKASLNEQKGMVVIASLTKEKGQKQVEVMRAFAPQTTFLCISMI